MKKLNLILISFLILFIACNQKAQSPEKTIEESIIGKWKIIDFTLEQNGIDKKLEAYDIIKLNEKGKLVEKLEIIPNPKVQSSMAIKMNKYFTSVCKLNKTESGFSSQSYYQGTRMASKDFKFENGELNMYFFIRIDNWKKPNKFKLIKITE